MWISQDDTFRRAPRDLPIRVADPAALVRRLQRALLNLQVHRSAPPQEEKCPICLAPFPDTTPDPPAGRRSRHARRKWHAKMQRQQRPFLPTTSEDALVTIASCGHSTHRACWTGYRKSKLEEGGLDLLLCPLCCSRADPVLPCDVLPCGPASRKLLRMAVAAVRALTPCTIVAAGETCRRAAACPYSHYVDGVEVQLGPDASAGAEEVWEDGLFHFTPPGGVASGTTLRSGRYPRAAGTRGTGQVPAVDTTRGRIVYLPPELARTELLADETRRYNTNLPPRNQRQ